MINSLLLGRKINAHIKNLSFGNGKQVSFIVMNKFSGIIELFEVVSFILFKAVTFLVDQIFDETALSLLNNSLMRNFFILKNLMVLISLFTKIGKGCKGNDLKNGS